MVTASKEKLQNTADICTFICLIFFVILVVLLANPPSGMAALWLMFPLLFVGFVHLILGIVAITSAIGTRRFLRNSWIFGYYLVVLLVTLWYLGFFHVMAHLARARLERFTHAQEEALYIAIEQGAAQDVARLLRAGADPTYCFQWYRKYQKHSPLQYAIEPGKTDIASMLLDAGVDPNHGCAGPRGRGTLLPVLLAAKNLDETILDMLLRRGVDLNPVPEFTVLGMAIAGGNYTLPSGVSAARHHRGMRDAAKMSSVVTQLVEAGADVNARQNGVAPLHWAVALGNLPLVDQLLKAGAELDPQDRLEPSPVALSIRYAVPEITQRLLSGSPRASVHGLAALLAIRAAGKARDTRAMHLLLQAGADLTPLNHQATHGRNVRREVDLAEELSRALQDDNDLLFNALLAAGADINQPNSHKLGQVLVGLYIAHPVRLQKLLAAGADVNARHQSGMTSLHYYAACRYCEKPVAAIETLIVHGADLNALDSRGRTPLQLARISRIQDTEEALLAAGAQLTPEDSP